MTGGLDAFDSSMRARQTGVEAVTERDVKTNARAAVSALEEVWRQSEHLVPGLICPPPYSRDYEPFSD